MLLDSNLDAKFIESDAENIMLVISGGYGQFCSAGGDKKCQKYAVKITR